VSCRKSSRVTHRRLVVASVSRLGAPGAGRPERCASDAHNRQGPHAAPDAPAELPSARLQGSESWHAPCPSAAGSAGSASFHHDDEIRYRDGPPAFWEISRWDPHTGVLLQRVTERFDG
jgi:hypothetical protein